MGALVVPALGKIWMPEERISYAGRGVKIKPANTLIASLLRPKAWKTGLLEKIPQELWRENIDPKLLDELELVWASVGHNNRTNSGAAGMAFRAFTATGTSPNSPAGILTSHIGLASATVPGAATDQSINSSTQGVTTNEITTAVHGSSQLDRQAVTPGAYSPPASLNAIASVAVSSAFTNVLTLTTNPTTVYGSALFDSITPAGSNMYVEANFTEGSVPVANGDTLNTSWALQH